MKRWEQRAAWGVAIMKRDSLVSSQSKMDEHEMVTICHNGNNGNNGNTYHILPETISSTSSDRQGHERVTIRGMILTSFGLLLRDEGMSPMNNGVSLHTQD